MGREILSVGGSNHNIITQGTKIVGNVFSESDFKVDGEIEGNIMCKGKVVVGQKGHVKGKISCTTADVYGLLYGNMEVADSLTLRGSSEINGDVITKSLTVEPNAVFNGTCSMRDKASVKE